MHVDPTTLRRQPLASHDAGIGDWHLEYGLTLERQSHNSIGLGKNCLNRIAERLHLQLWHHA